MVIHQVTDYVVVDDNTGLIWYKGGNAFRAHQVFFSLKNPKLVTKGDIQKAFFNSITAISERLN